MNGPQAWKAHSPHERIHAKSKIMDLHIRTSLFIVRWLEQRLGKGKSSNVKLIGIMQHEAHPNGSLVLGSVMKRLTIALRSSKSEVLLVCISTRSITEFERIAEILAPGQQRAE